MKRKFIINIVSIVMVALIGLGLTSGLSAKASELSVNTESTEMIMRVSADVIVVQYRYYNGKMQYRRWNETQGYWVDPYWIDC